MSYNIHYSQMLSGNLSISLDSINKLMEELQEEDFPEDSFLGDIIEKMAPKINRFGIPITITGGTLEPNPHPIPHLFWRGMSSGNTFEDILLKKIVPHLQGEADIVYTWDGGDLVGIRIKDGRAYKCDVKYTLVPNSKLTWG